MPIEKLTIYHLDGTIETYENILGGITAIGFNFEVQGKIILIHPNQVKRIEYYMKEGT